VSKPLLLWVDCTAGLPDPELRVHCASVFEVVHAQGTAEAAIELARAKPGALVFDFDYPDQGGLRAMQVMKQAHPKLPILMITLEHSESLAVWAFRARVWNFLVKPVRPAELVENLNALANLGNRASPPRTAQMLSAVVPTELPVQPISREVARLQPALHFVSKHYHERISATAAARLCNLSRFDFSRKFRAAFGTTFRDYLLRVRIMEARRLLKEGRVSVTGAAYSVGFNDGSHFARMFKRFTGVLPSAYHANVAQIWAAVPTNDSAPQFGMRRRSTDQTLTA
jgi:AraC-like DNA-binding protein